MSHRFILSLADIAEIFKTHTDPTDLEAPAKRGTAIMQGAVNGLADIADIADLEAPAKRGTALTDGAARAEPNIFELSRVVTEVDDKSMQGAVNGLADIADIAEIELDFMLMISLYLNEALLKTRFQDASYKYQPLFVNKEVLARTFINIKSHSGYSYYL